MFNIDLQLPFTASAQPASHHSTHPPIDNSERAKAMTTITTKDGAEIYYKDWGTGPVITFSWLAA